MTLYNIQIVYSVIENEETVTKTFRVGVMDNTVEEAKTNLQPALNRFMARIKGTIISIE